MCENLIWPKDKLTRFEVARLIGARTLQITLGAPVLIEIEEGLSSHDIAKLEFKNKTIPITVKRQMPTDEQVVINVQKGIENWLDDHSGEI